MGLHEIFFSVALPDVCFVNIPNFHLIRSPAVDAETQFGGSGLEIVAVHQSSNEGEYEKTGSFRAIWYVQSVGFGVGLDVRGEGRGATGVTNWVSGAVTGWLDVTEIGST